MSGNSVLLNTNALIYFFNGNKKVIDIAKGKNINLSIVTEVEILSYSKLDKTSEINIRLFLEDDYVKVIDFNGALKDLVIEIRRSNKLKLPDAIIAATSKFLNIPIVTYDKGFEKIEDLSLILLNN